MFEMIVFEIAWNRLDQKIAKDAIALDRFFLEIFIIFSFSYVFFLARL